jgi:FixJ family two-component response regulator
MTGDDATPTIHLVDDDAGVLRALARLLAASGYGCETYSSAEAFLSRPVSEATGCAIVDLQLPGVSGLDLQARLAQRNDALPVIFLTGRGDVGSSVRAMKGGAVDFLEKPVEPAALLAAIEAALCRDRERRARHRDRQEDERRWARLTPRGERGTVGHSAGASGGAEASRVLSSGRSARRAAHRAAPAAAPRSGASQNSQS